MENQQGSADDPSVNMKIVREGWEAYVNKKGHEVDPRQLELIPKDETKGI
jgi:hypothetical protein